MLNHSFVLDALEATAEDTFHHFEELIDEHRSHSPDDPMPSILKQLVPTVGTFHTPLPLRKAFVAYNKKYALTKRKHVTISFNELRHILNLAQVMALKGEDEEQEEEQYHISSKSLEESGRERFLPMSFDFTFKGPKMITFDGDQTLYSDGANFEANPELANYLYLLLRNGVTIAVVTAAGYEYETKKYELRLSGLLRYFKQRKLPASDCERFYLFGGECNYLLVVSHYSIIVLIMLLATCTVDISSH